MTERIRLVQLFFAFWALVVVIKLGYWQIVKASELKSQAEYQQTNRYFIPAPRGLILASDGQPLVANLQNYYLIVDPVQLPDNLAQLKSLINESEASTTAANLLDQLKTTQLRWAIASKQISPQYKSYIESLKLPGVTFESVPLRAYPEGSQSAYITGFLGRSSTDRPTGFFGLEGFYDRMLSGVDGKTIEEKDAFGLPIVIGSRLDIPAKPGVNLTTSIDRVAQHVAYTQLKLGLEKYQAVSGSVTIMDSQTGQIIAMVALPNYDPLQYAQSDPQLIKNPIVSDSYEPGSIFKTIVMASGLDSGVITPTSICSICSRPLVISGQGVRNYDDKYYPNTTMTDVILHSDNVGMVFVARQLGQTRFLDYLRRFGIGSLTGVDLQEESISPLRPDSDWYEIDWSTAAFGQGIAVTPLQMVTAVNCLARQGECIQPRVVKDPVQSARTWTTVSATAAQQITQMMVNGVENGAVKPYKPAGYAIAGKTGTAQVPIAGHYDADKTIASFVGFAPVPNPKFTMLVAVREPKTSPWGSTTAAPIWFEIAKQLFRHYQIPGQN